MIRKSKTRKTDKYYSVFESPSVKPSKTTVGYFYRNTYRHEIYT